MNRRLALKILGNTALVAGAFGGGRYFLLPPSRSASLDSVDTLAARFVDSLDAEDRKRAVVEYDHPFRQYHNRGVNGGGILGLGLNWEQRALLTDLLYAGLSVSGRDRIPDELGLNIAGVHALNVLVCGNPKTSPYQVLLTGAHLNLRLGGTSREGVAFGGPQVYGDQRGNNDQGLPGNTYQYQFRAAHRLFASLNSAEQKSAVQETTPIQTQIELQGKDGRFAGIKVATLSAESKKLTRELVDGILSTYGDVDAAYAQSCLDHNGGIDELHLSYYCEGEVDKSGQYQIFRLEGPAAVFYFRGFPHVHAFINVAMNGDAPLSVGESLGENAVVLEGGAVKDLFERAMKARTGSDLAYYHPDRVVGRLRTGTIKTGDIYNLESWQEDVTTVEAMGSEIKTKLQLDVDPKRIYSLATTTFHAQRLNTIGPRKSGALLRDIVIDHVRAKGFAA